MAKNLKYNKYLYLFLLIAICSIAYIIYYEVNREEFYADWLTPHWKIVIYNVALQFFYISISMITFIVLVKLKVFALSVERQKTLSTIGYVYLILFLLSTVAYIILEIVFRYQETINIINTQLYMNFFMNSLAIKVKTYLAIVSSLLVWADILKKN